MSSVKIHPSDKNSLEKLQANLKLKTNIKIDQNKLLGKLIQFGETKINELIVFLDEVYLTDDEIDRLETELIGSYEYYHPEKTDDELLYGENE